MRKQVTCPYFRTVSPDFAVAPGRRRLARDNALPRIERLIESGRAGRADQARLRGLLDLAAGPGEGVLSKVLKLLVPDMEADKRDDALRDFRSRLKQAAEAAGERIELMTDDRTDDSSQDHAPCPTGVRLSGAVLDGWGFGKIDLSGADLSRARLRSASSCEKILDGASMDGADLCGARLEGAEIVSCEMDEADFREASLLHASLGASTLRRFHAGFEPLLPRLEPGDLLELSVGPCGELRLEVSAHSQKQLLLVNLDAAPHLPFHDVRRQVGKDKLARTFRGDGQLDRVVAEPDGPARGGP